LRSDGKWGLTPVFFGALLAGAAAVLAFAPVGLYPLALVCFAILIHQWQNVSPREGFWLGFAFGMGLFLVGVSWVFVSLSEFGGMPAPLAGIATLGFCVLLALFTGFAGWLQARIPASAALRATLVVPACWTLGEWLRSWVFTGFPWLSAGYAATGWPIQGIAPIAGVFGMSFVTVSLAGLAWMIAMRQRRVAAALVFVAVVSAAEGLRHVEWTTPSGAPVTAALLQGNVAQDLKFRPERYLRTLDTYARLADGSMAKLIVFPETALPRLLDQVDPAYLAGLTAIARRNGGDMILGVPVRDGGRYYNSVIVLGGSGSQLYHKSHLVPFGEFVPPAFGWVMQWLRIPLSDFSRGPAGQPPLSAAGERVAISVCYEDAFGDELGARAAGATLLVNVSNVAWFGDSLAPSQHLQIARLRAVESGRMHLAATNTGVTAAIDRDGRVLARLPPFHEGRLEIAAQGYGGTTPYLRFADSPILLLALAILVAHVLVARLRRSR
jgi:apolipoprotein N-acyltransferase